MSSFGGRELLDVTPAPLFDRHEHGRTFWHNGLPQAHLLYLLPGPGVSHFFNEPCFLLLILVVWFVFRGRYEKPKRDAIYMSISTAIRVSMFQDPPAPERGIHALHKPTNTHIPINILYVAICIYIRLNMSSSCLSPHGSFQPLPAAYL